MGFCDFLNPRVVEFWIFYLFSKFMLNDDMLKFLFVILVHHLVCRQLVEISSFCCSEQFQTIKSYLIYWIHVVYDHRKLFPAVTQMAFIFITIIEITFISQNSTLVSCITSVFLNTIQQLTDNIALVKRSYCLNFFTTWKFIIFEN